jgi:RNA cap guanine-N2 methyltransferase
MKLAEESTQKILEVMRESNVSRAQRNPAVPKKYGVISDCTMGYGTITDCTACVGGNAINFAKHFDHVNAIELDAIRAGYLQHNVTLICGRHAPRVGVHHGDALVKVKTLQQDVLFFDPPWGGKVYESNSTVDLFLSGKSLSEVCMEFRGQANFLALKV